MKGRRARGEVISIALANNGQHQDTGAKMIHAADETTSNIVSKSISVGEGRATYRGQVHIPKHLKGCKNNTECDALLINSHSRTDTYPAITVKGNRHSTQHEASVSQVSEDMLFYLMQRGLSEGQAMSLAVNGFINDLVREFPMEYSVELKRLIDLEMEGSVGRARRWLLDYHLICICPLSLKPPRIFPPHFPPGSSNAGWRPWSCMKPRRLRSAATRAGGSRT